MNETLMTIVNSYLVPALMTFLTGFIAWIGTKIKEKYEEKVKNEEVRKIVKQVVQYVEQKFEGQKSEEKYAMALQRANDWLGQKGIEVSEVELDALIESSVYELTNSLKGENK